MSAIGEQSVLAFGPLPGSSSREVGVIVQSARGPSDHAAGLQTSFGGSMSARSHGGAMTSTSAASLHAASRPLLAVPLSRALARSASAAAAGGHSPSKGVLRHPRRSTAGRPSVPSPQAQREHAKEAVLREAFHLGDYSGFSSNTSRQMQMGVQVGMGRTMPGVQQKQQRRTTFAPPLHKQMGANASQTMGPGGFGLVAFGV